MASLGKLLPLAAIAYAIPASAQDVRVTVNVPAGRIDDAIRLLGKQVHASIGYSDARLAKLKVRAVRGNLTASQALARMLRDSGARARRVAPGSFVLEVAAPAASASPAATPHRASPRPPAPAAADGAGDDIVVTATKRDIPIGDYPGAVEVIDGSNLTFAASAHGSDAIGLRAASVSSTHLGPGRNKLFIRGIADSSFVGPTQATVGQYWGNSRITYSAPDPSLRLYDVQKIEVLEGPQGTLYGAGSLGGVVRVVPRSPDLHALGAQLWGGGQAVQYGKPGADGGAIVNVPLVDGTLGLRALAFGTYEGGYIDDVERRLNDVNRVHTVGGRVALRYEPGDEWIFDLTGLGQKIHGDDSQYADRGRGDLTRSSAIAQPFRNDYWLVDLVARKSWGRVELTSSIGYSRHRVEETYEGPALADLTRLDLQPAASAPVGAYRQNNNIKMLTAEMRLARRGADGTGWLVGLSVLHNVAFVNRKLDTIGSTVQSPLTGVRNNVDEYTLYGEATVRLVDGVTLTGGGRATRSRLEGNAEDVSAFVALRVDPNAAASRTETRLLPSVALAYRAGRRWTLFARYQEGFRPGGIAARLDFIQRFAGDRIKTLEAGARLRSSALESSFTVSWSDWRNIQADLIDGFGFPTTANIGDGRVLSVGWSGKWHVTPQFTLEGAFYLNDSRIITPAFATLPAATGRIDRSSLPNVADKSGRLAVTYSAQMTDRSRIELTGYGRYFGKSVLGVGSILGRPQGNYLDTGIEARVGDARRGVSLSLTNLLDTRGNRFALGSPFLIRQEDQITPLQPRSLRLGFDLAF